MTRSSTLRTALESSLHESLFSCVEPDDDVYWLPLLALCSEVRLHPQVCNVSESHGRRRALWQRLCPASSCAWRAERIVLGEADVLAAAGILGQLTTAR